MPPHAFAYRGGQGVPSRIRSRALPIEAGVGPTDQRYHLIGNEDVAEQILEYDRNRDGPSLFRHLSPDELEETLGSAKEAVAAIEAGEVDRNLDLLLVAERNVYDGRVTVIEAIEARNRVVIEQRAETGEDVTTIQPEDIVTVRPDPEAPNAD